MQVYIHIYIYKRIPVPEGSHYRIDAVVRGATIIIVAVIVTHPLTQYARNNTCRRPKRC